MKACSFCMKLVEEFVDKFHHSKLKLEEFCLINQISIIDFLSIREKYLLNKIKEFDEKKMNKLFNVYEEVWKDSHNSTLINPEKK